MTASMQVRPLPDTTFGAVVTGVALRDIDAAGFADLYRLWLQHALLVLPGQHLTNDEQVKFARRFGGLEIEITPISNVGRDGQVRPVDPGDQVLKVLKGNQYWHADSTYMPVQAKGAVFTAHVVPKSGGETGWADMRAAYEALDDDMKTRLESLSARHSIHYSQARMEALLTREHDPLAGGPAYTGYGAAVTEAPLRPLVKRHPETGRPSLNIGRHAYGIPGMDEAESEQLLTGLIEAACQPPRVYHHQWSPGDVVIWDNRCLLHRACPWDFAEPRVMYHSRLAGHPVTEYASAA
jgi:alpha-ketoglutarate-dependent taurine dioxygenase